MQLNQLEVDPWYLPGKRRYFKRPQQLVLGRVVEDFNVPGRSCPFQMAKLVDPLKDRISLNVIARKDHVIDFEVFHLYHAFAFNQDNGVTRETTNSVYFLFNATTAITS